MGIDDPEWRRLCAQMHENAHQRCMFENIREIAGMKRMAVIHECCRERGDRLLLLAQR